MCSIAMPYLLIKTSSPLGSLDCFVQFDHKLHKLNHIFYHKICHVIFCEFTYVKRLLNYLTKGNLIPEFMARNDGHACAQRLVNKQQFYQTSMLKFIGVTLGKCKNTVIVHSVLKLSVCFNRI